MKLFHFALFWSTFYFSSAVANEFFVVVNNSNKMIEQKMTKEQVKSLFLGYTLFLNDQKVTLMHLEAENDSMNYFLEKVIGMDKKSYTSFWRRKLFSGKGTPPKEFKSEAELILLLKKTPNAIGIIPIKPNIEENIFIIPESDLVLDRQQ